MHAIGFKARARSVQLGVQFHFALTAHRLRLAVLAVNAKVDAVQSRQIAALAHLHRIAGDGESGIDLCDFLRRAGSGLALQEAYQIALLRSSPAQ